MKRIQYTAALIAFDPDNTYFLNQALIFAVSEEEAYGIAMGVCKSCFPEHDGFSRHDVNVGTVTELNRLTRGRKSV